MRLFRKIRVQLVAIVLVCYLVPTLVLGVYMDSALIRGLQAKTEAALDTGLEYALMLTEENLQKVESLSRDAIYDGELTDAAARRDAGDITDGEFLRLARNYIERKYSREALLTFAACFTLDNPDLLLVNRSGFDAAKRYQQTAHDSVKAIGMSLDTRSRFVQAEGGVYLVRNLVNLRMNAYGMLVLGLDMGQLTAPLGSVAREWDARLDLRLDDVDIADITARDEGAEAMDWSAVPPGRITEASGGRYAVARESDSRDYALRLGLLIGRARLYGEINALRRLLVALLALLAPILVFIAWYVYRRITRPIAILSEAANRIEAGELGVTVPMRGDDELGTLGKAFSNMSLRLQELIDRTYKEEIALRDARIQAMQSRINPHFINNALETINWQARLEQSETISAMVESLSVLLNAGMSRNNRRMVTLREELDVARAYFFFVGLRFGDRLATDIDAPEDALSATVPLLTLQPLIENAVEHGIAPADGGEIRLSCARLGPCLRLRAANSGKPLTPEDRRRIDAALAGNSQDGAHLGLSNISTRLQLIYGGRASIAVESDERGWTEVTLDIPQDDLGTFQGGERA